MTSQHPEALRVKMEGTDRMFSKEKEDYRGLKESVESKGFEASKEYREKEASKEKREIGERRVKMPLGTSRCMLTEVETSYSNIMRVMKHQSSDTMPQQVFCI